MDIEEQTLGHQDAAVLQCVLNAISDPVFVKDEQHRWVMLNDAFCELMGHSANELLGKSDFDFFSAEEARVFWEKDDQVFASGTENLSNENLTDPSGARHTISTKKRVVTLPSGQRVLVGVLRDMTKLRLVEQQLQDHQERLQDLVDERTAELRASHLKLEREMVSRQQAQEEKDELSRVLRHKQRLDEMGQLAGGVAHDFNNLLTVILGNLAYLRGHVKDLTARGAAFEAHEAAMKAANLSRQLLAFSRRQPLMKGPLDMGAMAMRMQGMMSRVLGEHIELDIHVDEERSTAFGDEGMLEQVFLNLLVNARDALDNGGRIEVEVEDVVLEALANNLPAGHYVRMVVKDNGEGMDAESLERAFEPFFTTKPVGKGTGLGLSTVHGIIQQHDGHIELDSVLGKGTTCTVWLPASSDTPTARPESGFVPVGNETILVVEDEPLVARVARRILRDQGYHVLLAKDGAEALEFAKNHSEQIKLLLTDVRMPGMNGVELAEIMTRMIPDLDVLYVTGYSADVFGKDGADAPVLAKPYTRATLTNAVRAVLDNVPMASLSATMA